jgi:hypothetical protein
LGFGNDAIFFKVKNINVEGRFAFATLVCVGQLIVDKVCTYSFPPIHKSSSSCLIWLALVFFFIIVFCEKNKFVIQG